MRLIAMLFSLGIGMTSCGTNQTPNVETANCIPPPIVSVPPTGVFNSENVIGTVHFAYTTCGLNIYTKNSETFEAKGVSKISIRIDKSEIVVRKISTPVDLSALSIVIKSSDLPNYVNIFNALRSGEAEFIIYTSNTLNPNVAKLICGDKECGQ